MKPLHFSFMHLSRSLVLLTACFVVLVPTDACAQHKPTSAAATTIPAVMLSDLHFDPYHDPAKFARLQKSPASAWQRILAEPDSPTQAAELAKLLHPCGTRGEDTPWALLQSSLAAAHAHSPHALFVTVSGDLLAHSFDCRFHLLAKGASDADSAEFASKTVAYVASELHRIFPLTPIYLALGNNDSGCGDYRETPNSDFLQSTAESFGNDVGSPTAKKDLLEVFPASGNYSIELPKPIVRGRLIVLQDIFLSTGFAGCNGKPDSATGAAQLEWLRTELTAAHQRNEQVWVMAHIPPGVNLYTTLAGNHDVCAGKAPVMFLRDEKLVDVLTDFAADIRLAIFAHTHMDEMRLLQRGTASGTSGDGVKIIAAKLVPSISPINRNYPAFTLADVDPQTATLKDYRVIAADNKTGIATRWSEEYRYSTTYHATAFDPKELATLLGKFTTDKDSEKPESLAYEKNFIVGDALRAIAMRFIWPAYVCSMHADTVIDYRDCSCPAK